VGLLATPPERAVVAALRAEGPLAVAAPVAARNRRRVVIRLRPSTVPSRLVSGIY
jgi:hypothetical protein